MSVFILNQVKNFCLKALPTNLSIAVWQMMYAYPLTRLVDGLMSLSVRISDFCSATGSWISHDYCTWTKMVSAWQRKTWSWLPDHTWWAAILSGGSNTEKRINKPSQQKYYRQLDAPLAFQMVLELKYVDADCFARTGAPVVIPTRTFLSRLFYKIQWYGG